MTRKTTTELPTTDSTARALLALMPELAETLAAAERLRKQLVALAGRHGVQVPPATESVG